MEAIGVYYSDVNLYSVFRPPSKSSPDTFGYWVNTFWDDDQDGSRPRAHHTLDEEYLLSYLKSLHAQPSGPALTIISLDHDNYDGIAISEPTFRHLLRFCNIETGIFSTLHFAFDEGIDTISFDNDTSSSSDADWDHENPSPHHTNIVITDTYKLISTFNPSTSRTLAILFLVSPSTIPADSLGLPPNLCSLLTTSTPPYSISSLLPYICTLDLLESIRNRLTNDKILRIERQLTHAAALQDADIREDQPLPRLSRISLSLATQRIAVARYTLAEAEATRLVASKTVRRLLDKQDVWWCASSSSFTSSSSKDDQSDKATEERRRKKKMREIRNGTQLINHKLNQYEALHPVQRTRLDTLSGVVFHMMTQRDAEEGIELAKASKDLAVAAGRDASSMKTIAVVTMGFLPGTFFAALFALPGLRFPEDEGGGEEGVVRRGFWVYLYFTVPCTVVVFLVWGLVNHEGPVRRWVRRRIIGGHGGGGGGGDREEDGDSSGEGSIRDGEGTGGESSQGNLRLRVNQRIRRRFGRGSGLDREMAGEEEKAVDV